MSGSQVLIIGLDGATFDLIEPWVAAGDLPNLGRLMQRGAWGRLRSTMPPTTFPAWSSMMTGVNPGRHGIFDFTRRLPGRYAIEFVNATHRRHPTMWRVLTDAGCRVGVIGLPATYPPEPVNGVLIAGFDAPVTTGIDASFVYPRRLYDEIRQIAPLRIADFQESRIGPSWHADALSKMQAALRDRATIAEYLLTREMWDCFMVLFGESDTVSHHFWAFHDPASPRYQSGRGSDPLYADAIRTIYRQLDVAVGRLVAAAPDATVVVLSDHGFGGTSDKILYINRWLAEQGYLRFQSGANVLGQSIQIAKKLGLRWLPRNVQEQVFRRGDGWLANRMETSARFSGIDWASTRAFSEESNTCPSIWLNLAGREPAGTVPRRAYREIQEEIVDRLLDWRDPFSRQPVVAHAWRREELYQGPYVDEAPDIILEPALDGNYAYTCSTSHGRIGPIVRRLTPPELIGAKGSSMNGSHRSEGVLILAGPGIRCGQQLCGANLMDVAPTILALLYLTAPARMDGRVLDQALDRTDRQLPNSGAASEWMPTPIQPYAPYEAQRVRERLQNLGYLE